MKISLCYYHYEVFHLSIFLKYFIFGANLPSFSHDGCICIASLMQEQNTEYLETHAVPWTVIDGCLCLLTKISTQPLRNVHSMKTSQQVKGTS